MPLAHHAVDIEVLSKSLRTLVPEIQLLLFAQLDTVSVTCLAVTCRYFYETYKRLRNHRKPAGLNQTIELLPGIVASLGSLLCGWVGESMQLVTFVHLHRRLPEKSQETKFVTRERFEELKFQQRLFRPWVIPGTSKLGWTVKGKGFAI